MQINNIRDQFPIINNNSELSYLDNAASTQKPQVVIDAMVDYYQNHYANVHRGLYPLSERSTDMYEAARAKVAGFLNAVPQEIVFTSGTTDSLNGLAVSLGMSDLLPENPTILLTELEHHANILPWQRISQKLDYIPITDNFELDYEWITGFIEQNGQPDILAITHISNVTGTQNDISRLRKLFSESLIVVDAAQSVAHMPVDVRELDLDFLVFSGHKLYGPTGIGALYGKLEHLQKLVPFRVGGGMIREVHRDHATWSEVPERFEAGTPPIAQAIGMAVAVDFLESIGWEGIIHHEKDLVDYAIGKLGEVLELTLFRPGDATSGVFSFTVDGLHPHDLSQILGEDGVAVRAGHHCCQILHRSLQSMATTRASIGFYNNKSDIDRLIAGISHAQQVLG